MSRMMLLEGFIECSEEYFDKSKKDTLRIFVECTKGEKKELVDKDIRYFEECPDLLN